MTPVLIKFLLDNHCSTLAELADAIALQALLKGTRFANTVGLHGMLTAGEDYLPEIGTDGLGGGQEGQIVPKRITFIEWLCMTQAAFLMLKCDDGVSIMIHHVTYGQIQDVPLPYFDYMEENWVQDTDDQLEDIGTKAWRTYVFYIEDFGRYGVVNMQYTIR